MEVGIPPCTALRACRVPCQEQESPTCPPDRPSKILLVQVGTLSSSPIPRLACLFPFFLLAHWHEKGANWRGLAHTPAHKIRTPHAIKNVSVRKSMRDCTLAPLARGGGRHGRRCGSHSLGGPPSHTPQPLGRASGRPGAALLARCTAQSCDNKGRLLSFSVEQCSCGCSWCAVQW